MTHNKKRKVLLAEPDKNILEILVYLLRAWEYSYCIADDGLSVIEMVKKEQPDIIIVDSNLPKLDGLKTSKFLKEDFLSAHIPVIILIDKKQIRKKMLEIEQGVDDYIVNPPDPIDLEVRIEMALRRSSYQLHVNALTRLPGNRQIEKNIHTKIEGGEKFSVLYFDIDNFKTFNDKYGYMKGDNMIRHLAYIISKAVKKYGSSTDFVGHIGGDDFVVVTTPGCDRLIASESVSMFDKLVSFHYSEEDRVIGFIVAKDRRGNISEIPLMSISIAIANNEVHELENTVEIMEIISEIKHYLKSLPGSNFLINRRSPSKSKMEFEDADEADLKKKSKMKKKLHHKPLGQILLDSGVLNNEQLEIALNRHWNTGQKIGQSAIDLGLASVGDIARALEMQFNIPHFDMKNLDRNQGLKDFIDKIPYDLMKKNNIIPVDKDKDVISLVMLDPKNIDALDKIKRATGCKISSFFVLENEFEELWGKVIKKADKGD
ncbi:MAG: diguanylate cyclase [Candidatus Omnitrophota bacterium]